jgi:hypothetical protein
MSNEAKVAQLRARTDRDLLLLVERDLDRGLALAYVAASKQSPLYAKAQTAYGSAMRLLPRIIDASGCERRRCEAKLHDLRTALEWVPAEEAVTAAP